jgi:hypothetical protein
MKDELLHEEKEERLQEERRRNRAKNTRLGICPIPNTK